VRDAMMTPINPGFRPPPRGEDLPHSDGEPMETQRHVEQMLLLIRTLKDAWRDRSDVYVGGNMFIYFSELQAKRNDFRGPDVFVVMDTVRRERKSWVVWEEDGKAPDVVIELISPSTEHVDRGEKMRIYAAQLKVAEYYLFDPFTGVLEGYELDLPSRSYRRRAPDAQGRLASRATGLALGVAPTRIDEIEAPLLRWFDERGNVLTTAEEREELATARAESEAARAESEAARAEKEAARADDAQRRIEELERRLGTRA
jgi:Uma2 family endonuclease